MRIYWTQKRLPKYSDANEQGQVLATNSGYQGFKPVSYQEVTAEKFNEWSPLDGPVQGTDEERGPQPT